MLSSTKNSTRKIGQKTLHICGKHKEMLATQTKQLSTHTSPFSALGPKGYKTQKKMIFKLCHMGWGQGIAGCASLLEDFLELSECLSDAFM